MKSWLSRWLGVRVGRRIATRADQGRACRTSFRAWNRLPRAVRAWLNWRALAVAEDYAQRELSAHPIFGQIIAEERNPTYAMSALTATLLIRTLEMRRPASIAEFGCGLSTCIIAAYARQELRAGRPRPHILSFEHDEAWMRCTEDRLSRLGLRALVDLIHAPLRTQWVMGRDRTAYALPACCRSATLPLVDLCFIDGPPDPIGRAGSLGVIADRLAHGALIFLDDAFREHEQEAIQDWMAFYKGALADVALYPTMERGVMRATWQGEPAATRPVSAVS
jgi:predicted O-methyltransferase YrrM